MAPDESRRYHYTFPEGSAGLHWFHPHPHQGTARQVAHGLAGALLVRPPQDVLPPEVEEHLLVVSDLRLTAEGEVAPHTAEDWMNGREGELLLVNGQREPRLDGTPVLILPTGPADRFETASLMIQQAINAAHERIWISSPYFVPDEGVLSMLKLAALSGVDVRVLIPERPDNPLTYFAAYAFLGSLLEAGVEIYRYEEGFLHGKAFLVDDIGAAVGTVNLDNRSFRLNFEVTAMVLDPSFAEEVESMFEVDFARARQMQLEDIEGQPLWHRVAARASYLLAPVL